MTPFSLKQMESYWRGFKVEWIGSIAMSEDTVAIGWRMDWRRSQDSKHTVQVGHHGVLGSNGDRKEQGRWTGLSHMERIQPAEYC